MLKTKNFPRTKYRQGALYINEDEITKALEPKSFFFFILFFFRFFTTRWLQSLQSSTD